MLSDVVTEAVNAGARAVRDAADLGANTYILALALVAFVAYQIVKMLVIDKPQKEATRRLEEKREESNALMAASIASHTDRLDEISEGQGVLIKHSSELVAGTKQVRSCARYAIEGLTKLAESNPHVDIKRELYMARGALGDSGETDATDA